MTTASHSEWRFRHTVRVPYAHTDQMGFVYYAHYFVYFEMARSEFLRECDLPYTELEDRGVRLPVVEAHCEYRRPARFDDLLTVLSRCRFEGPRLCVDYELRRGEECLAVGHTVHVCLGANGRPTRPVSELRRLTHAPGAGG